MWSVVAYGTGCIWSSSSIQMWWMLWQYRLQNCFQSHHYASKIRPFGLSFHTCVRTALWCHGPLTFSHVDDANTVIINNSSTDNRLKPNRSYLHMDLSYRMNISIFRGTRRKCEYLWTNAHLWRHKNNKMIRGKCSDFQQKAKTKRRIWVQLDYSWNAFQRL